jgi:hypothetical protein
MRNARIVAALLLAGFVNSACVSPRSYVDTSYPPVNYDSVQRRAEPLRATVVAEFHRNGTPYPRAQTELREIVIRVLRGSGVFAPADTGPDGEVQVTVNNIADLGSAAAQGAGTGLTLGAIGTTVTDNYEMAITLNINGVTRSRSGLRHALHTAIGNTSTPAGVQTTTSAVAFQRVVEEMLLTALRDMQRAGDLDPRAPVISSGWPAGAPKS